MNAGDLLDQALDAEPDSAERILYAAAAFNTLTSSRLVLVGGAAQVTHTGVGRLTDIDVVGVLREEDVTAITEAGFERVGRHWVYEDARGSIAVEIPDSTLAGELAPEMVDVEGVMVRVISLEDLMMDRLMQATDGTDATWNEAALLAEAAHHRIDWEAIERRCRALAEAEPFLRSLPALVGRLRGSPER